MHLFHDACAIHALDVLCHASQDLGLTSRPRVWSVSRVFSLFVLHDDGGTVRCGGEWGLLTPDD